MYGSEQRESVYSLSLKLARPTRKSGCNSVGRRLYPSPEKMNFSLEMACFDA